MEVTNCFAVPHAERDEEVAIGKDFNRQMLALHLRANRNETVVGWYATAFPGDGEQASSNCLANTSSLIHEFYTVCGDESVREFDLRCVVKRTWISNFSIYQEKWHGFSTTIPNY